jgi:hypothetical protein
MVKKAKVKVKIEMVQVANLDADKVFQGVVDIPRADVTDAHVLLPRGCDLPPGKYRWDSNELTFKVIQKGGK